MAPQFVKAYQYRSPDGKDVFQVARYHPKDFRPRRLLPNVGGGEEWIYSLNAGNVKRVQDKDEPNNFRWVTAGRGEPERGEVAIGAVEPWPYNADLLARFPDRLVIWCEGEKDADTAMSMGFLATTVNGGAANQKWIRDWNTLFRGRMVVFFPHNDRPGYDYAAYYAGALTIYAGAAGVSSVRLPKQPEKGDLSDYVFQVRGCDRTEASLKHAADSIKSHIRKANGYSRKRMEEIFAPPKARKTKAAG